ncbi:MAG: putrescine ABC transporter permease PotI [Gammaproteobacteria bacterium]|nr:MAG: putrescine ABC transporter permease PotI [Gammaproteobacteria bacterium]
MKNLSKFNLFSLLLGYSFLYIPIIFLVIYSFNESRLVTVWGGFSTKWYGALWQNDSVMQAAWVTLRIAFVSSLVATILGTFAGLVLARFNQFRGRTLFNGMIYSPLVMPDVIIGISLLLMFVALGMDRGFWTITLAHITFSMCYVAVVVRSRMMDFDRATEEAAQDLGCPPARVFFYVILPIIAPSVLSGFLLAFTLSLDDLVIASFATGSGTDTLPIKIYSMVKLGVTPEINALSTILIGIVASGVLMFSFFNRRQELQRQRDKQLAAQE